MRGVPATEAEGRSRRVTRQTQTPISNDFPVPVRPTPPMPKLFPSSATTPLSIHGQPVSISLSTSLRPSELVPDHRQQSPRANRPQAGSASASASDGRACPGVAIAHRFSQCFPCSQCMHRLAGADTGASRHRPGWILGAQPANSFEWL